MIMSMQSITNAKPSPQAPINHARKSPGLPRQASPIPLPLSDGQSNQRMSTITPAIKPDARYRRPSTPPLCPHRKRTFDRFRAASRCSRLWHLTQRPRCPPLRYRRPGLKAKQRLFARISMQYQTCPVFSVNNWRWQRWQRYRTHICVHISDLPATGLSIVQGCAAFQLGVV